MSKIILACFLILFFSFSSCFNNEKRKIEKEKSILYDKNINIDKIMREMKLKSFKNDSLTKNYLSEKLTEIRVDTIIEKGEDSIFCPRFILSKYGDIFKNNHKYLIVYEQTSFRFCTYYWFLKTKDGFIKFYERDSNDGLYIKDSIFDTDNDGKNELVAYKHRGGSGPDYKVIYFLNNDGLINKEVIEKINKE